MKVFISWSGEISRKSAYILRDWLPAVIQVIEPWLSSRDIPAGARWAAEISKRLEEADVGIVCLTKDNLNSEWILYEAGALSKKLDKSLLCIYGINLSPRDVSGPLSQFQIIQSNKEDTFRLLQALNSKLGDSSLNENVLQRVFEAWWPSLESSLNELSKEQELKKSKDKEEPDKLDTIIELLEKIDSKTERGIVIQSVNNISTNSNIANSQSSKPRLFIGSSVEGLKIAEVIQLGLDYVAECTIWNQSVFRPSETAIESIVDISKEFDYAVIILSPDDMVDKRGDKRESPRDNIIFELGLFTGTLGRSRTFMVYNRDIILHLPSDLAGVTAVTYTARSDNNLEAALGPVCTRIKQTMGVYSE